MVATSEKRKISRRKRAPGSLVYTAGEKPAVSTEFPSTDVSLSPLARLLYNFSPRWLGLTTGRLVKYRHALSFRFADRKEGEVYYNGRKKNRERRAKGTYKKQELFRSKQLRGNAFVVALDSKMTPLTLESIRSLAVDPNDSELSLQLRKIALAVITVVFQVLKATYRRANAVISYNTTDRENFQSAVHLSRKLLLAACVNFTRGFQVLSESRHFLILIENKIQIYA